MDGSMNHARHVIITVLWITALPGMPSASQAEDFSKAEQLFADHCAVCHGADRGGYIGPALNSDQTKLTQEQVSTKIKIGGATTLMPQHPTWPGRLSAREIDLLTALITTRPKQSMTWGLNDIRKSLEVLVANESGLPGKPAYPIENLDDLMAIMVRGRFAAGDEARVVFFDGRTNKKSARCPPALRRT